MLEIYRPYFKHIVFYSSKPHQEHTYECLYFSDTRGGHSGYKALIDFYYNSKISRSTDGILYLMDDVLLNINYLKNMDLTNPIYFSQDDNLSITNSTHLTQYLDTQHWGIWARETGRTACQKVITDERNKIFTELDFFAKLSDFFYLPNKCITEELINYLEIFNKYHLHLEIAIPSLFKKLFYQHYGIQTFNALPNILGGNANITNYTTENFKKYIYLPNLYVHRVKLSSKENQNYVRQLLKQ